MSSKPELEAGTGNRNWNWNRKLGTRHRGTANWTRNWTPETEPEHKTVNQKVEGGYMKRKNKTN